MRYGFIIAAVLMAITAALPAQAFGPNDGRTSATANVRSGPANKYEIIGKIRSGTQVQIIGCARTWEWCDVEGGGLRGWVPARFLLGYQDNHLVSVINYGEKTGIRIIAFDEPTYWSEHYTNRDFYQKRYGMREDLTHSHQWRWSRWGDGTGVRHDNTVYYNE